MIGVKKLFQLTSATDIAAELARVDGFLDPLAARIREAAAFLHTQTVPRKTPVRRYSLTDFTEICDLHKNSVMRIKDLRLPSSMKPWNPDIHTFIKLERLLAVARDRGWEDPAAPVRRSPGALRQPPRKTKPVRRANGAGRRPAAA